MGLPQSTIRLVDGVDEVVNGGYDVEGKKCIVVVVVFVTLLVHGLTTFNNRVSRRRCR